MVSPVVSTWTAPLSARSGPSSRVMSRRSRSTIDASTSLTSPPISRTRRWARSRGDAVTNSFNVASGKTTVPMSRPSITPPPRSLAQLRWRPRSSSRTAVLAATELTASVTARPRMSAVASTPSTTTEPSWTDNAIAWASSATVVSSLTDTPRARARNATARYIAPVSRYSRPRRSANARPTVLLPAPAGPSMAMTRTTLTSSCRWGTPRRTPRCSARPPPPGRRTRPGRTPRRTCTPIARRPRSGRGCPRHPGAPGRGTSATC